MKIKEILQAPLNLKVFKRGWNTVLYTDYSSKGIGFCLTQENPEKPEERILIYCVSASLTKKQKKLPAIYCENLTLVAALEKCKFWLHGGPPFNVRTNHQALSSIYNTKSLDQLPEELESIVVSTFRHKFKVEKMLGKLN